MVPFYQRAYVWTRSNQWEYLWKDIEEKAESRLSGGKAIPHFLGAAVFDPQQKDGLIGVEVLHIIDGQQRLSTFQFVLKSSMLALQIVGDARFSSVINNLVYNSNEETMHNQKVEKYKLWPTFRDQPDYIKALGASELNDLRSSFPTSFTQSGTLRKVGINHPPALEAIWYFTGKILDWLRDKKHIENEDRAESLVTALLKDFKFVSIVLERNDDAQVIFETLNGRGAQLHATDLIRNYIFMRADRDGCNSKELYDSYWSIFESDYWNSPQNRGRMKKPRVEWFIHSFLQAMTIEEVDYSRLYFEYRRYSSGGNKQLRAECQLKDLTDYSALYKQLISGENDSSISRFGRRISAYEVSTLHPLALVIGMSDLPESEKTNMYDLLVSLVVRRSICGLTSKNYNNVFLSILKNMSEIGFNEINLKTVICALSGEGARWPRNEEFFKSCTTSSMYPGVLDAKKMRGVLSELELKLTENSKVENCLNAETGNLDVEHILPRSWYKHWPLRSGRSVDPSEASAVRIKNIVGSELDEHEFEIDKRESLVNTLGNLTLLDMSVNRQAQNREYAVKKDLLLRNTNLRLNIDLLGFDEWGDREIIQRGETLAYLALVIWKGEAMDGINEGADPK